MAHEYAFDMGVGRVQGYQLAFFMLQGLAVAATLRWKPRGPVRTLAIIATLAFNLATSMLFFASIDSMVPLYDRARNPSHLLTYSGR